MLGVFGVCRPRSEADGDVVAPAVVVAADLPPQPEKSSGVGVGAVEVDTDGLLARREK